MVILRTINTISKFSKMYRSSATDLLKLPKEEVKNFLDSFDTVLTDCDGVLWYENNQIEGSPPALNRLREIGKRVFFVTNNSTKIREEYVKKAQKLGYIAEKEEILCTSYLACEYLKSIGFDKKVYLIGSTGVTQELDAAGIKHFGVGPDVLTSTVPEFLEKFKPDKDVGCVLVAFDSHFSYPKMIQAATYLHNPDVLFLATNSDERLPTGNELVIPGTGSIVRAIETCSERKAMFLGKPEKYIRDAIDKKFTVVPERTLMIGDRCNTDILLGTRCGFQTLLVLSGVTRIDEVVNWQKNGTPEQKQMIPDFFVQTLGDILPYIQ